MSTQGRLDIHYPDGKRETYQLSEDAVTIGSAADNTIVVPAGSLAPRQLRISQRAGAFFLSNLAPAPLTLIDDAPAPINEPQRLHDAARIRAGELRIVFKQGSDTATAAVTALSQATQPTAAGFRAALETGEVRVWQYSSASVALRLRNMRAEEAVFKVETGGPAAAWTSPDQSTFSVAGKDSLDLLFHIVPSRFHDISPGDYPLTISARRLDGGGGAVQLLLLVQLGAVGGLSAALDPPKLRPGHRFSLRLLNLGNSDLPLRLLPSEPQQLLQIKLGQDAIQLGAGESAVISGTVALRRRPLIGKRSEVPFVVLLQAHEPNDYALPLPAAVTVRPLLEKSALIAAALAIGLLLLAAALLLQPAQPAIASFTLSESMVAQGTPVALRWTAQQTQRFVIEVNRAPIAELPGDAASYELDTSRYVDPIDIALIALNGERTDIRSQRLAVYQPATVIRFETDKAALLRDMPSELIIRWRVEGAAALDIALPAGFETVREIIGGGEGEIVISGAASDDFQISLAVADELGTEISRTLPIEVRAPECTPLQDTMLFTGPSPRYERANYALRNVTVLVNGVNAGSEWLQVELASGERGWGLRSSFRCYGFDPSNLKIIGDFPPLPTGTPTPALSATASPAPGATR